MANRFIDQLPSGPKWVVKPITLKNTIQQPSEPTVLFMRDAAECVQYLLSNPLFSDHLNFTPVKHFDDKGKRLYREPVSGIQAWETQVCTSFALVMSKPLLNLTALGEPSSWCNADWYHSSLGWDTVDQWHRRPRSTSADALIG